MTVPPEVFDDHYQARYTAHQERKRHTLIEIMRQRHSDRMYAPRPVSEQDRAAIREAADLAPSSCDRRGVTTTEVYDRDRLALLGGLLVGGVGWVHRAPVVFLLIADPVAYKAGNEVEFMPFLDAGAMAENMMLRATDIGLATAFINPSIRDTNRDHFRAVFGEGVFCGAVVAGWPVEGSPDRAHHAQRRNARELGL